jgi:hypothetical protein
MELKKYLGFEKPYNFPSAINSIFSIALIFLCLACISVFHFRGWLHVNSYRFYFLYYLLVIAFISILFVNKRKSFLMIIMIFSLEFGLAFSSVVFNFHDLGRWLLPMDGQIERNKKPAFERHSLLQITPKPNVKFEYGEAKVKIQHNNLGLRGVNLNKQDFTNRKVIAFHGGSTTYDEGTHQGYTWPEQIQRLIGDKYLVINAGVPGYSTAEHLIQANFYDQWFESKPFCSIYYVGWNDIRNFDIPNLDGGYADFWLPTQFSVRPPENLITGISPTLKLLNRILAGAYYSGFPQPKNLEQISNNSARDRNLEKIYRRNLINIAKVNDARQIRTVFIPQVLNTKALEISVLRDANIYYRNEPRIIQQYNDILYETSKETKAGFIPLRNSAFSSNDFVDTGHFNRLGSAKMARSILAGVLGQCSN